MILPPFDPAAVVMLAAVLRPAPKEPAVAIHTPFADRLAGFGFYGPFRVRPVGAVIEDRAGHPFIHALPVIGPADQRQAATIACLALNQLCGFEAADAQTGPMADAAE